MLMTDLKLSQNTWNLTPLFASNGDAAFTAQRKALLDQSYVFIDKWQSRTDYLQDPKILLQALSEYEHWVRNYGTSGKEGYYFTLRTARDQSDPDLKAKLNKVQEISIKIGNDIKFFIHRLAKVPVAVQKIFLADNSLAPYHHFLTRIFNDAQYLLSEPEEKILNLMMPTAMANWVRMRSEFLSKEVRTVLDEDEKPTQKTFAEIWNLINSKKKIVRDTAAQELNAVLAKHADVAEHEMNSILATKKAEDELRGFDRPDFERHLDDDIDSDVVDVLLEAVSQRFTISKKFYELKSKLLNLPKLAYHERGVEYGTITKKYPFSDALNLVQRTFHKLDPEFADVVERFALNGQLDVFPRKNKYPGAFCICDKISTPGYILLNYEDKLEEVLTVAHEFGHAINDELMKKKQNALNFGSPLSTAEVASTFMEDFVLQEILQESDDELKLTLLMMKMNEMIGTIQRQTAGYMFEQELHKTFRAKGYLAKEAIGEIFTKHMTAYMGDFVEQSPGSQNWWIHWSHFREFFYVYSYASGLLISMALQNAVKHDPTFITKVKDFLATGSAESPLAIFAKLGIDIKSRDFWNKGLDQEESLLEEIEQLAKKLRKF